MKKRKKRRLGSSKNSAQRHAAGRPNHVWSWDFIFDRTTTGKQLKWLAIMDEFTRESLCLDVGHGFTSEEVIQRLVDLSAERGLPKFIRSDNGPEFIAVALRKWLEQLNVGSLYIEPGSPWENAYIESFRKIAVGDSTIAAEMAALRYERTGNVIEQEVPLAVTNPSKSSAIDFLYVVPPVTGTISRGYQNDHPAVDVVAPRNTPIKAILDGYVISSDWTLETGNTIGIQHSNDLVSFYKHNARNLKKMGAFVKAGEAVAIIGNTGELSSGPHLHFELWVDGLPVDPALYIDFK